MPDRKPVDIRVAFGDRVRSKRIQLGFSQEELADKAGLDRTYVGGIERGKRNVSLLNIRKIASALGVAVADLFENA
jgi:transcriptional regulator with XRE-family HTH domain